MSLGYIYLVQMEVPAELEGEFNRIYDEQHVPCIMKVKGVRGCTRYILEKSSNDKMAKFAAIYEIDSPELPYSAEWKEASDTGDWKTVIRPHSTNRSHTVFKRVL